MSSINPEKHKGKTIQWTLSAYPGDDELANYISQYLGCSKSEAVRSAVRAYAHQLSVIERRA